MKTGSETKKIMIKNAGKKNRIKILIIILALIAAVPVIFFIVTAISVAGFLQGAERLVHIPDLDTGFIPQGLEYIPERSVYLMSGYMPDGSARVKIVSASDGKSGSVRLLDERGEAFICHAGGIAKNGEFIYISGGNACHVLKSEEVLGSDTASVIGSFNVPNNASFCTVDGEFLYVGEYYHPIFFETEREHRLNTPSGEKNPALVFVYRLDGSERFGVAPEPVKVYSITDMAQGMCFGGGNAYISSSAIFHFSRLYRYDMEQAERISGNAVYIHEGREIPLCYLDKGSLTANDILLPMSEGVIYRDGRTDIVFESAADRFFYGKFFGSDHIYSAAG